MKKTLPAANRSTVRPHLNTPCRKVATAARAGRALLRVPLMAAVAPVPTPMSGRALPRVPLIAAAAPEKHPIAEAPCAVAPAPAAVRDGVVLRSAADRTALYAHWLAPHLSMVHGIVRRHSCFASECADNFQSVVLHLLEHLDALAHFALRCARRPHGVAAPAASAVIDTEERATPDASAVANTEGRTPLAPPFAPGADSLPEVPPLADTSVGPAAELRPAFADDTENRTPPAAEIAEPQQPVVVTADAVMHTAGAVDPRPWLAGVTLRLLSTLNGRALRHRATHLTPASSASDEPFDSADPDGGVAPTAAAAAQSEGVPAAAASTALPATSSQATTRGTAARESTDCAPPCADDCLERWHGEAPRPGFHRTAGGRLWKAMRERAQQAHSAFAYRTVLRADAAEALAALPLRDRALVLLTADGWTAEEIGLAIGTSPTAVRQTVCRVRMRLRRWRSDERDARARRA